MQFEWYRERNVIYARLKVLFETGFFISPGLKEKGGENHDG